jgi:hypothetical protein
MRSGLRPFSAVESDQSDHWFDELDRVLRHVGLQTKPMFLDSPRPECSHIADSTDIYATFKRLRLGDANDEQVLRDAVISGLNQEGFSYVHTLLTQMHKCYQENTYVKKLLSHMVEVAERAHLRMIKDQVASWIRTTSHATLPHSESVNKQLTELRDILTTF